MRFLHSRTSSLFPVFAFILGRIALIFPNRFAFTSFFRNFAIKRWRNSWTSQASQVPNSPFSAKKGTSFFVLLSTFRNFAANND